MGRPGQEPPVKTIILEQPGLLRLADGAAPDAPEAGMALVRVRRVGICGTDLHAFRGDQPFFHYPRILGHELSVEVLALGPSARPPAVVVGDRCAVNPYLHCGHCSACRRGKTNCCERMQVMGVHIDGGMQEFLSVPIAHLHESGALSLDQLALVEMLCIGAHAVGRAQLAVGEDVLVIGAGPIGLGVMRFAQLAGANVVGMEVSAARQAFGRRQLRVAHWIDGRADPIPQIREAMGGSLPTVVFDATGNATSMEQAFNYVEHGGKLVFVGLHQGDVTFHDSDFHRRELTLLGSRNATAADFAAVIATLAAGKIDLAPWITVRVTPEELPEALPGWLNPAHDFVKAMLDFD
jgi:2-desacetyl-2-hydroxyethyl bacteriochlorophyllide A dehydrogenase